MNTSEIDLSLLHVQALFVHDENDRLLRVNEPEPSFSAPRFFLSRTMTGNLWRTRTDLPDELSGALARLAADEPIVRDLTKPPRHEAAYKQLLEQHAPVVTVGTWLAYTLPQQDAPQAALMVTPENVGIVEAHFAWLLNDLADYAPVSAVVMDGNAVSVCFCSRITAQAAEAGLYTEAAYRGHGYAAETVRGWANAVRATGRLPLYSTSWENRASQAVARKLSAVQYAVDYSVT